MTSLTSPLHRVVAVAPDLSRQVLPDVTVLTFTRRIPQDRLDGTACILCGQTAGSLVPAGFSKQVPPVGAGQPVMAPIYTCQSCTRAAYNPGQCRRRQQ